MKIIRFVAAACLSLLLIAPSMGYDNSVSVTPTIQNAAYAASNSLGGLQTITFFKASLQPFSGLLDAVWIASKGGSTAPITFYIFDKAPTASTCTDKTAFSLGAADVDKLAVTPFVLTPAVSQGTTITTAQLVQATSMRNKDAPQTASLYICLVVGSSVTPASTTDIVFKLSGVLD